MWGIRISLIFFHWKITWGRWKIAIFLQFLPLFIIAFIRKVKLFRSLECKCKRFFSTFHSFTIIYNPGICPHCGNHFLRLKQHIVYKHTTEKPFKCEKCDFAHALPKGKVSILGVGSLLPFSYWVKLINLRGNCRELHCRAFVW